MNAMAIHPDEDEEVRERFICFPENFFIRIDFRKLHKKWPQTLQWFMAILIAVKSCENGGRLVVSGVPVTIEDVDILHCWDTIDPDWVRACVKAEILSIDLDGCIVVNKRRRYIKYPSETPAAEKARRAKQKTQNPVASEPKSAIPETNPSNTKKFSEGLHDVHESTSHESKSHDSTEHDSTKHESIPPTPQRGEPDGRTDSFSQSVASSPGMTSGGSPPEPPSPRDCAEVYSQCAQQVASGKVSAKDFERYDDLVRERERENYTHEDLNEALEYAVAATRWAIDYGPDKVRVPRAYMAEAARNILPVIADRNIDRRASQRDGFRDPGPIVFKPPEQKAGGP